MTSTALVLAVHGSNVEPAVNARIHRWAEQIAALDRFTEVAAAFHQGSPGFAEVLDQLSSDEVIVVPVMTSEGYYGRVVLPRELARNASYAQRRVHITPPVGTHAAMPDLLTARAMVRLRPFGVLPATVSLAIVGHGTQRHEQSRRATVELAEQLAGRHLFGEVLTAFLDEPPLVETILDRATHPTVLVVPFLISDGPHTTRDLPRRLGMSGNLHDDGAAEWVTATNHGGAAETRGVPRWVVCDTAIGTEDRLVDMMISLADELIAVGAEQA